MRREAVEDETVTCHLKCQIPRFCFDIVQLCSVRSRRNHDLDKSSDHIETGGLLLNEKGQYQDSELGLSIYTTAYVLIRNATPEMYLPDPFRNPDLRKMWITVVFILTSQMLALLMLLFFNCPVVNEVSFFVDCDNATQVNQLIDIKQISHPSECPSVGPVSFEADLQGRRATYRKGSVEFYFYENTFGQSTGVSLSTLALQVVCCLWVHVQVHFTDIRNIKLLLRYTDFSYWFLKEKDQTPVNEWAIIIPLASYTVSVLILCLSYNIICGFGSAFDIVSSSVGFTFIANVSEFFNYDLIRHYRDHPVPGGRIDTTSGMSIMYLYPEYEVINAVWEGERVEGSWYLLEEDKDAGFLHDFKFRYRKGDYVEHSVSKIKALNTLSLLLPACTLFFNFAFIGASRAKLSFL